MTTPRPADPSSSSPSSEPATTPRPAGPSSSDPSSSGPSPSSPSSDPSSTDPLGLRTPQRLVGRLLLGGALLVAGVSHLTSAREEFQAQVPTLLPVDPDLVVVVSGFVEIALGAALVVAPRRLRPAVGLVVAAFFVAIFPGNISQLVTRTDAFGLDSDAARAIRLLFQPLLVLWALWSTGAWRTWRARRGPAAA